MLDVSWVITVQAIRQVRTEQANYRILQIKLLISSKGSKVTGKSELLTFSVSLTQL